MWLKRILRSIKVSSEATATIERHLATLVARPVDPLGRKNGGVICGSCNITPHYLGLVVVGKNVLLR
jgi:hypothetical protein